MQRRYQESDIDSYAESIPRDWHGLRYIRRYSWRLRTIMLLIVPLRLVKMVKLKAGVYFVAYFLAKDMCKIMVQHGPFFDIC